MAKVISKMAVGSAAFSDMKYADVIPTHVIDKMLTAEADVIQPKIQAGATNKLRGRYWTGKTASSIYRKAPHNYRRNGQRQITLTFRGTRPNGRKRKRNAEVAFVNEYGATNLPTGKKLRARPFIQEGIDERAAQAFDNAEAIYDEWLREEKMI